MTTKTKNFCVQPEDSKVNYVSFRFITASPWIKDIGRKLMEIYGVLEEDLQDATQKDLESRGA